MLDIPPDLYAWVVLPLFIFTARLSDVGLSTIRIVFIAQGRIAQAAAVGFCESLIWLVVIGQILQHLENPVCVVAYAGGFAAGNAVGLVIERRLAIGLQAVRIITQQNADELQDALVEEGFGVTAVPAEGSRGPVKILFTVVRRRDVPRVSRLAEEHNPRAFLSIADVRKASEGVIRAGAGTPLGRPWLADLWRGLRKAK